MEIKEDTVYLYRMSVDGEIVAYDRYAELAYAALSRLELELPPAGTIAIKPNITIPAEPDSRIITHPGFVAGMIKRLLELGVAPERIAVMEGYAPRHPSARRPRSHARVRRIQQHSPEHRTAWKRPRYGELPEASGYAQALDEAGLELVNHDESEPVEIPVPEGVVFRRLRFPRCATEAAFLFNVPVAKCHNLALTTLCTKNLQGLVLSPQRHMCSHQEEDEVVPLEDLLRIQERGISLHEERFCQKHGDLITAVRHMGMPRLCVVDGMVGRDGTAFNQGRNWPLGWTLVGRNETHVDAVGTYLFGLDPEKVPYLQVAEERGLGTCRIGDIEVVDLKTGRALDRAGLAAHRHDPPLMPVVRYQDGYTDRFRADGSLVPWALDRVNQGRAEEGLEPIPPA